MKKMILLLSVLGLMLTSCTQETQNKISRSLQNWTGTNGVLEIYAGEKTVHRFMKIDKLSTAYGTESGELRPYRYGYGIHDENLNGKIDEDEKKSYFEFSDNGSTRYFFYEKK